MRMDKENVEHGYNGIILSNKKELNICKSYNVDEHQTLCKVKCFKYMHKCTTKLCSV